MHGLTSRTDSIIVQSGARTGVENVSVVGSTAAIGTVEFEPGLKRDLPDMLDRLIPPSQSYGHEQAWHDGNGHSHLKATLIGPSVTLSVSEGEMAVGTWQQLFLIELDIKPRVRELIVTVQSEKTDRDPI